MEYYSSHKMVLFHLDADSHLNLLIIIQSYQSNSKVVQPTTITTIMTITTNDKRIHSGGQAYEQN